jgi:hypothetical protein
MLHKVYECVTVVCENGGKESWPRHTYLTVPVITNNDCLHNNTVFIITVYKHINLLT